MPDSVDARKAEVLRKAFCLSDYSIRRVFRDLPEIADSPDLIPKLEYLTEHFPPIDWRHKSCSTLASRGFFRLTYDELLLCASAPDRMGFSDEDRASFNRMVLYWDNPYDFKPLIPLLNELCGDEYAEKIATELCFPIFCTGADKVRAICERLLSYPGHTKPWWFGLNWLMLFSRYADPLRALDELDKRFEPEHVLEVFMSREDWGWIGYALNGGGPGGIRMDPQDIAKAFAEAETDYWQYRLVPHSGGRKR